MSFDNNITNSTSTSKFLGGLLNNLIIESLLRKFNRKVKYLLLSNDCPKDSTDLKTKTMVYSSLFYSIRQYCIEFWGRSAND